MALKDARSDHSSSHEVTFSRQGFVFWCGSAVGSKERGSPELTSSRKCVCVYGEVSQSGSAVCKSVFRLKQQGCSKDKDT